MTRRLFVGLISYLSHKRTAVRIKALIFVTAQRVLFSFHRERSIGKSLWTRNLALRYSDFVFANPFAWDLALQGCRRRVNHRSCWYCWKLMSWTSSGVLELCLAQVFPGSPCSTLHTDYFKCFPLSKPSYPPSSPAPSHAVPSVSTSDPDSCIIDKMEAITWQLLHFPGVQTWKRLPKPVHFFHPSSSIACLPAQTNLLSLLFMPPCSTFLGNILCLISLLPGVSDSTESACNAGEPSSIPGSGRSPGDRNGNPLQYSCLGNPMNRGPWQATVCGFTKNWTWLSDWHFLFLCSQHLPLYQNLFVGVELHSLHSS